MVTMETTKEELLKEANEYLIQQNTGFLATTGSAGLRVSPVSIFMNDEMGIFMHCYGGDKMVNLRENSEVCLLVIEEKWSLEPGLYEGVQVFGEAKEITEDSELYSVVEEWCPYDHDAKMTMIQLLPKKMIIVDYENEQKRKRAVELDHKPEGQ